MPRFFKEHFEKELYIDGADAHHIIKSLRMRVGEPLTVCDTKGTDYDCIITDIGENVVNLKIIDAHKNITEPSVFVTLYQCLPKGDKMDTVIKQSVECGVGKIVPLISTNCVSRPDEKSLAKKISRWQKIADEAAGQCGRGILPTVCPAINIKNIEKDLSLHDQSFFCYELGGKPIETFKNSIKTASVIIGPEGGFTKSEAEMLTSFGATATTLGPRILRTETAPLVALTAIMYKSNNMK